MNKKEEYIELLSKTYDEAVETLLDKYGPAEENYFSEKSYNRFLAGEIKSITRRNYSRTSEGLYCHHIDENRYKNISDFGYIKSHNYPFELQKKDRLVYCDLFEHAILHVLIAKETDFEFGIEGYEECIAKKLWEWYVHNAPDGPDLNKEWSRNCYAKAYLNKEDALEVLDLMDASLG